MQAVQTVYVYWLYWEVKNILHDRHIASSNMSFIEILLGSAEISAGELLLPSHSGSQECVLQDLTIIEYQKIINKCTRMAPHNYQNRSIKQPMTVTRTKESNIANLIV